MSSQDLCHQRRWRGTPDREKRIKLLAEDCTVSTLVKTPPHQTNVSSINSVPDLPPRSAGQEDSCNVPGFYGQVKDPQMTPRQKHRAASLSISIPTSQLPWRLAQVNKQLNWSGGGSSSSSVLRTRLGKRRSPVQYWVQAMTMAGTLGGPAPQRQHQGTRPWKAPRPPLPEATPGQQSKAP